MILYHIMAIVSSNRLVAIAVVAALLFLCRLRLCVFGSWGLCYSLELEIQVVATFEWQHWKHCFSGCCNMKLIILYGIFLEVMVCGPFVKNANNHTRSFQSNGEDSTRSCPHCAILLAISGTSAYMAASRFAWGFPRL